MKRKLKDTFDDRSSVPSQLLFRARLNALAVPRRETVGNLATRIGIFSQKKLKPSHKLRLEYGNFHKKTKQSLT